MQSLDQSQALPRTTGLAGPRRPLLRSALPVSHVLDPRSLDPLQRHLDRIGVLSRCPTADAWLRRGLLVGPGRRRLPAGSGGTAATTSSPTSSRWSSRARSTGAPGNSPGRCAGSSAVQDQDRPGPGPSRPTTRWPSARRRWPQELGYPLGPHPDRRRARPRATTEVISDRLDEAAAVLADPNELPVYFHCHHGINRASMVQIAYRTKYCGWTLEQATDEIARTFGLVEVIARPRLPAHGIVLHRARPAVTDETDAPPRHRHGPGVRPPAARSDEAGRSLVQGHAATTVCRRAGVLDSRRRTI